MSLARRKSGGGCVYQDLKNTCFSFFIPIYDTTSPLDTREQNNIIILDALASLEITGEVSGRNDLLVDGKKFSGSAYELDLGGVKVRKKALHHGTLMIDVDVNAVWEYLNPNKKKLESKGVDSVISRVTNLIDHYPSLDHAKISDAMFSAFAKHYNWCEVQHEVLEEPLKYDSKV